MLSAASRFVTDLLRTKVASSMANGCWSYEFQESGVFAREITRQTVESCHTRDVPKLRRCDSFISSVFVVHSCILALAISMR